MVTWSGSTQEDSSVEEKPHTEDEHVASSHQLEYHSTSLVFPESPAFHSTSGTKYDKIYQMHLIRKSNITI